MVMSKYETIMWEGKMKEQILGIIHVADPMLLNIN